MKHIIAVSAACLILAACAEGRQRSLESRSLGSGVTSSNGGGQFQLHNQPNVGISQEGTTVTGIRNRPTSPQNRPASPE
jgi:hypothetical protein